MSRVGFFSSRADRALLPLLCGAAALGLFLRLSFLKVALSKVGANADEILNFLQAHAIADGSAPLFFWTQPYQFPFEAYLLSHFVDVLPWSALGVRILPIALCLLAVLGFLLIFPYFGSLSRTWPGVLLVCIPSTYWLIRQVGLLTPQHAMSVTFMWLLPLICGVAGRRPEQARWGFWGGLAAGMALSNHLLLLSMVVPAVLAFCLSTSPRSFKQRVIFFVPGLALGLAPYWIAVLFVPGAYAKVAESLPLSEGIARLWDPILAWIVPAGVGIVTPYIGDVGEYEQRFRMLVIPFAVFYTLVLTALTLLRGVRFFARLRRDRWPTLELADVFLGCSLAALLLLCLTGMDLRIRYALPLIWSFPFVLTDAYQQAPRLLRMGIGAIAVLLICINVRSTIAVKHLWSEPQFAQKYGVLPELAPLYAYFEAQGITRCYSSWWLAYRIVFDSQERIICSPPFNDRFRGWPQPFYRRIVDEAEDVPYVEGRYVHTLLRTEQFAKYLLHHQVIADRLALGEFIVYDNFRHRDAPQSHALSPFRVESSIPISGLRQLGDGDYSRDLPSPPSQREGLWIRFDLDQASHVHGVELFTGHTQYETEPPRLDVEVLTAKGDWQLVLSDSVGHPHLIRLAKNRPPAFIPKLKLMLGFPSVEARAVRLRVRQPGEAERWLLREVALLVPAAETAPTS